MKQVTVVCRSLGWAAFALSIAALSGCGGVYDSTVSGVVTLDGNPVPRGTVTFHPTEAGPSSYARIEEDGTYSVQTGRERGLPPGEYQVTVIANEPPPVLQTAAGGPPPSGKPITPPWYRSKQTSGLRYTVENGSNEIDLELSSEPPPGQGMRRGV